MAGVKKEAWLAELVKKFRLDGRWLNELPDYSSLVNNDVIHLTQVGADPTVLINNSSYPIAVAASADTDIPVSLDKFDTTNTAISKDELYAIEYDKMATTIEQHSGALLDKMFTKAAHNLAPADDTSAATPVVKTTGAANANINNYKRATVADLIEMKNKFDLALIPDGGRIIVASPHHINDWIKEDSTLYKQLLESSQQGYFYAFGFKIYQFGGTPMYNASFVRKAFGATAASTDRPSSVAFYAPRMFKAEGSMDMFWQQAENDPMYRRHTVGFQARFLALPKTAEAYASIVSA